MKKIVECSKIFESHTRMQMLLSLLRCDLTQGQLVNITGTTSGAIATHAKKLIAEDFITVTKFFKDNKPCTVYSLTEKGKKELFDYIKLLEQIILPDEKDRIISARF